jgi:acetyl esterase/lipase
VNLQKPQVLSGLSLFLLSVFAQGQPQEHLYSVKPNLNYLGGKNPRQTLDLFIPENRDDDEPLPLIIWIHGGGWRGGDKKSGHAPNRIPALVSTGRYIGATIGYRLSEEALWPAQIHDCKAAVRWLRARSKKFGINPEKIAVWGTSAGGHLASMLGTSGGLMELEGELGKHRRKSSRVQAVINGYGPSALLQMDDHPSKIIHNAPYSPESKLMGAPIQKAKAKALQASPINHASADDPPFLHFHGTHDQLVPFHQSEILHQALLEKKVASSLITIQGGGHRLDPSYTRKFVLPFIDFHFHDRGMEIQDQTIPNLN